MDTAKILANLNLERLLSRFQSDSFIVTNKKEDIPRFLNKWLDCTTNDFSLANPGKPYQETDLIISNLPRRQLIFLAKSKGLLVMTYLTGIGFPKRILFVQHNANKIEDVWVGQCFDDVDSKDKIIESIKKHKDNYEGLNTNMIYL